jgi:hypothetical protein
MSRVKAKTQPARTKKKATSTVSRPKKAASATAPTENPKLAALKRAHFTKKGRAARIARAKKTLEEARWDTGLDIETIKWIAEDPDLEFF